MEAEIHMQLMEEPTLAQVGLVEGKPGQANDAIGSWQGTVDMWKKETMLEHGLLLLEVYWQDL